MLFTSTLFAQTTTIDYSSLSGTDCNVFAFDTTINNIIHHTTVGQPSLPSGAVVMNYNYGTGNQTGTGYRINYNFEAGYKYLITITAKNGNSSATGATLQVRFGSDGSNSDCLGNGTVTNNGGQFLNAITGTTFNQYTYDTGILSSSQSIMSFLTMNFSGSVPNPSAQTFYIQKITIEKVVPPMSFTLSPTSASITCGDISAKTFTVTPVGVPSGSTISYVWSYNGWTTVSSTANSKTLQPSSGTSLPSSISVTPYINGVAYPSMSCSVSRASFGSSATITGTTNVCTGTSSYTITGVLAGQTVSWSLSNPSIATLSNQTTTGTNVTFNGNGAQTLTATIGNTCGQTVAKSFLINTGSTTLTSNAVIAGSTGLCSGSSTYTISGVLAGQNVTWGLSNPSIATLSGSSNSQTTVTFTGNGSETLYAYITNSCGQTATKTYSINVGVPQFNNFTYGTSASSQSLCFAGPSSYSYSIPQLNSTDKIIANFVGLTTAESGVTTNWQWATSSNIIVLNGTKNTRNICTLAPGTATISVRVKNSCGWSDWATLTVDITELPLIMGKQSKSTIYQIYPNPSKDIVNIDLKDQNNQLEKGTIISGELFDMIGQSKSKVEIKDNKATFSVRGLNKGIYILKIYINDQVESHQIVVE